MSMNFCLWILPLSVDALPKVDYSTSQPCPCEKHYLLPLVRVSLFLFLHPSVSLFLSVSASFPPPTPLPSLLCLCLKFICMKVLIPSILNCNLIWRLVLYWGNPVWNVSLLKGMWTFIKGRQWNRQKWLKWEDMWILCFRFWEVRMSSRWFRAHISRIVSW